MMASSKNSADLELSDLSMQSALSQSAACTTMKAVVWPLMFTITSAPLRPLTCLSLAETGAAGGSISLPEAIASEDTSVVVLAIPSDTGAPAVSLIEASKRALTAGACADRQRSIEGLVTIFGDRRSGNLNLNQYGYQEIHSKMIPVSNRAGHCEWSCSAGSTRLLSKPHLVLTLSLAPAG